MQTSVEALGHQHEATQTGLTGTIMGAAMRKDLQTFAAAIAQKATRTASRPTAAHATSRSLTELWAWAAHIASVRDGAPFAATACHGDVQADNLLWDGTPVRLLDWDEATMNDPRGDVVDLAFPLFVGIADLAQVLEPVAFDPQTRHRGRDKLAWAHVHRYLTA